MQAHLSSGRNNYFLLLGLTYCSVTHEEEIVCNYSILHSLYAVNLNGLIKSTAFPQNVKTTIQKTVSMVNGLLSSVNAKFCLTLEGNTFAGSTQHNAQEKIWMYEIESEIRLETIA
jgi:hypothetical protein